MVALTKPQIVHESEAQRQHVRLPLPAIASINGQTYETKDLSAGGVSILNITGSFQPGTRIRLNIKLPFSSFSLDVNVDAEILHYDAEKKMLGCRFADLDQDQLSVINHALKAFMAGDIVRVGDILMVSARDNFVKARKAVKEAEAANLNLKKQIPGIAAFALMGLLASYFIISNIYESLFIIKTPQAYVSGPAIDVRATGTGFFKTALAADVTTVHPNQILGSLNPDGQSASPSISVQSPCDCFLIGTLRQDGEYVTTGEKLVSLVPVDSTPWIIASVDAANTGKLKLNAKANIAISGSQTEFTGRIVDIKSVAGSPASTTNGGILALQPTVQVKIAPDHKLPVDLIGRPAKVSFAL